MDPAILKFRISYKSKFPALPQIHISKPPELGRGQSDAPPSSSATPASGAQTTSSHYQWQITISHTHWHSIQPLSLAHHNQPRPLASHPRHDRTACKAAAHFPYFTIQPAPLETAAQTDLLAVHHARHHRRPSGMASSSRATASQKTIRHGIIKSHDDISEDRHERQARRASGRRPCRGVGLRPRALPQHVVSARQRYQRSTTTWGRHVIPDSIIGAAEVEEADPTNRIHLHWMGGRVSLYERQITRPTL